MQPLLSVNTNVSLLSVNIAPSTFLAAFTLFLVFLALYLPSLRPFGLGAAARVFASNKSTSPPHSPTSAIARRYYRDYQQTNNNKNNNTAHNPHYYDYPYDNNANRFATYFNNFPAFNRIRAPDPIELRDHPPLIEGLPRATTLAIEAAPAITTTTTGSPAKDRRILLRSPRKGSTSPTKDKKKEKKDREREKQQQEDRRSRSRMRSNEDNHAIRPARPPRRLSSRLRASLAALYPLASPSDITSSATSSAAGLSLRLPLHPSAPQQFPQHLQQSLPEERHRRRSRDHHHYRQQQHRPLDDNDSIFDGIRRWIVQPAGLEAPRKRGSVERVLAQGR